MPRRSGSSGFGRSSSRSQTPPPRQTATHQAPPQQQAHQAPPQQQTSGGMFSGLGQTLVTGMAFGAGSEVAHQAVRGLMGSGSGHTEQAQEQVQQQQQTQQYNVSCSDEQSNFSRCLQQNNEISSCQTYLDMLKECQNRK